MENSNLTNPFDSSSKKTLEINGNQYTYYDISTVGADIGAFLTS